MEKPKPDNLRDGCVLYTVLMFLLFVLTGFFGMGNSFLPSLTVFFGTVMSGIFVVWLVKRALGNVPRHRPKPSFKTKEEDAKDSTERLVELFGGEQKQDGS